MSTFEGKSVKSSIFLLKDGFSLQGIRFFALFLIFFAFFIFYPNKAAAQSEFDDFSDAVGQDNFNIDTSNFGNPLQFLADVLIEVSSGTIKGLTGANSFTFDGVNHTTGFRLNGTLPPVAIYPLVFFFHNFVFENFAAMGAVWTFNSTANFIDGDVIFNLNAGDNSTSGAISVNENSEASFLNSNVSFTSNKSGGDGGAISAEGSSLFSFSNSSASFIDNSASDSGGAAAVYDSSRFNSYLSTITFERNIADGSGGAIFVNSNSRFDLSNSLIIFTGNSATDSGGAIFVNNNSRFDLSNSTVIFTGNSAPKGGAVAASGNSIFNVSNSRISFTGNIGVYSGAIYAIAGANFSFANSSVSFTNSAIAIYSSASFWTFSDSIVSFTSNAKSGNIGALSASYGSSFIFSNSTVNFIGNTGDTSGGGGAIEAAFGNASTFTFSNSKINFTGNISNYSAGAIAANGSIFIFSNSTVSFTSNAVVRPDYGGDGGALHSNSSFSFSNSVAYFISNLAARSGGAISARTSSFFHFSNSTAYFLNNAAGGKGGAIAASGAKIDFSGLSVSFTSNAAADGGGAVAAMSGSSLTFANSKAVFSNNVSTGGGGGAISANNSIWFFSNSSISFTSNSASNSVSGYGGAIFAENSTFSFSNYSIKFSSNVANNDGGAVSATASSLTFFNFSASFTSNSAGGLGGAISAQNSSFSFSRSSVNFINNSAVAAGGAISAKTSSWAFSNSTVNFTSNSASSNGGAIFAENTSKFFFSDSIISFMYGAVYNGGAVYAGDEAHFDFSNSIVNFASNSAVYNGGAVFSEEEAGFTFSNSTAVFISNTADKSGGAIAASNKANFVFSNSSAGFIRNSAVVSGGAIFAESSSPIFSNSLASFIGNVAASSGGAIYAENSTISFFRPIPSLLGFIPEFISANFINNYASVDGGALYGQNSYIPFTRQIALFQGNSASDKGGAIYLRETRLSFTETSVTFSNNRASSGGAIYAAEYSTIVFSGVLSGIGNINEAGIRIRFIGNSADRHGGAIFIADHSSISFASSGRNVLFSNNGDIGGANDIYFGGNGAYLQFSVAPQYNITMDGGIADNGSTDNLIVKSGNGLLHIKSVALMAYNGRFDILGGITSFSVITARLGTLSIAPSGKFAFDGNAGHNLSLANLFSSGTIAINLDLGGDISDTFEISGTMDVISASTGTLYVNFYGADYNTNLAPINVFRLDSTPASDIWNFRFKKGNARYALSFDSASQWVQLLFLGSDTLWNDYTINYRAALPGNTIELSGDINASAQFSLPFLRPSSSGFTMDGKGHTADSVGRENLGLIAADGASITIKNLAFKRFISADGGAALTASDTAKVLFANVVFSSNRAVQGGAIYGRDNSELVFQNGTADFMHNTAQYGGAILTSDSIHLSALNLSVTFNGNSAALGGAFLAGGVGDIVFDRSNVKFTSNSASNNGGAIFANNTAINFSNSTVFFTSNSASQSGGAVYLYGVYLAFSILNSSVTFANNSARDGGVFYARQAVAAFNNSTGIFVRNSADRGGAAYFADNSAALQLNNNSFLLFENNRAQTGGALYLDNAGFDFENSRANWISNTAVQGGAVYADGTEIKFNYSIAVFTKNSARQNGGALYAAGYVTPSDIVFSHSSALFSSNMSGNSGGAVYMVDADASKLRAEYSTLTFKDNISEQNGGAIYAGYQDSPVQNTAFEFSSLNFEGNIAYNGGALFLGDNSRSGFLYSTANFIGNSAHNLGGAFYISSATFDVFSHSKADFIRNTAGSDGGALYIDNSSFSFSQLSLNWTGNIAEGNGGALYINRTVLNFTDSISAFLSNTAGNYGGALYIGGNSKILFRMGGKSISFIGNKAGGLPNDFYLEDNTSLELSADAGQQIIMDGGIIGGGIDSVINKNGGSLLHIRKGAVIDYNGAFNINAGIASFSALSVNINSLKAESGSTIAFAFDGVLYERHTAHLNSLISNGSVLSINADLETGLSDIFYIGGQGIRTEAGSKLIVNFNHTEYVFWDQPFDLFYIRDGVYKDFDFELVSNDPALTYELEEDLDTGWVQIWLTNETNPWNKLVGDYYRAVDGDIVRITSHTNPNINALIANKKSESFANSYLGNALANFEIRGNGWTMDSKNIKNLGFEIPTRKIHFENLVFTGFVSNRDNSVANNNKSNNGAVIAANNATLEFRDIDFIRNTASGSGGAVYLLQSSASFNGASGVFAYNISDIDGGALNSRESILNLKDIDFAYNTAGGKGGALYLSNGKISIEADEKDIVFRGNIANASSGRGASANDIHLYNNAALTFFAPANKTISLSGGIVSEKGYAGENRIVKDGYGTLLLKDGSKIETVDSFLIREGLLKFEMPVEYSVMADMFAVFSDGALEISVDFKNKKASSIAGINTVNISEGAKLLIDVSESPINRGDKLPIIYANNTTEPSALNLTENGRYRFSFDWERGENFKYIGYLIYEGMKPIKNPVFYANIRTLPVRFFWDYGPLSGGKRIYIGDGSMLREEGKVQSAWIMADIFGLNHKSGESGIGDFKSSGRGVQAGYDLFRDGGVFISYQNINAEQDGAEAFIGDFELGLYKTINVGGFMLLNGMLSAGAQNFEVEGGAEFGAKSIKFLLETEHIGALSIANLFLSLRGGYIANEEINESGFIMEADGYLRTEFLGGAKRSYQINPFLSLGWKAYIGLPILTSQYRQTFKSEIGDIKGAESGNVFGGIGGRGEYKIKDNVNLFAGLSFEFDETFTAYTAYLGASLKLRGFSNLREEPKEVKLVEVKDEAEKAVEQEAPEAKAEISDSEMLEQAKQRRETAALSFRLSAALFEVDSWDLSEEANLNIEAIATALKGFNITNLVVEGHTDSTGSDDINRPLSKNRAEAVLKALILNGVVTDKMESAGFGSLLPIVSNDNHESRRLNRRVEIFVEGSDRIEYSIPEDETSGAGISEDNKTQNAAGEPSAPEQPKQDGAALKGQNAEVK